MATSPAARRHRHIESHDDERGQHGADGTAHHEVGHVLAEQRLGGVDRRHAEDVRDAELALPHERQGTEGHAELLQHEDDGGGCVPVGDLPDVVHGELDLAAERPDEDAGIDGGELVVALVDGVEELADPSQARR